MENSPKYTAEKICGIIADVSDEISAETSKMIMLKMSSGVDYVEYHEEFMKLIDILQSLVEKSISNKTIVLDYMLIINFKTGKYTNHIESMKNEINILFKNNKQLSIDEINSIFNYIRTCFREKWATESLINKLLDSIFIEKFAGDTELKNIIFNHQDVLDLIHESSELVEQSARLDEALDLIWSK